LADLAHLVVDDGYSSREVVGCGHASAKPAGQDACGGGERRAAITGGPEFTEKNLVFDSTGKRWLAVFLSESTCEGKNDERWEVVSLDQRPDGTLVGDWTQTTLLGCFAKRTVTFTRTGDIDESDLPDPTSQPRKVRSPAEALQGRYHEVITVTTPDEYDDGVRTDCLRTGERCMSYFVDLATGSGEPFVYQNGKWIRNDEFDSECSSGGTSHVKVTAEFPLPDPVQDPIMRLEGKGFKESTGTACKSGPLTQVFTRTGD
jgi:serine/threonine-protein kinase